MDDETKHYRLAQLSKLSTVKSAYLPVIKIVRLDGQTNWMDITEDELLKIKHILTSI